MGARSFPHAAAPHCCRAIRLAAFPRLAALSDEEWSELRFALLLRSLPKAILAYKLLAPNTEEWKQGGLREAGLLGTRPVKVPVINEPALHFEHAVLLAMACCLSVVFAVGSILSLLWSYRPLVPVSDWRHISYPAPLSGSFNVFAPESWPASPAYRDMFLVTIGGAFVGTLMLVLALLVDLVHYTFNRIMHWRLLSGPRRRLQRLLTGPVNCVTLYSRMLPGDAAMPSGVLELGSDRPGSVRVASAEMRHAVHRVRALRRCGDIVARWAPYPDLQIDEIRNDPALCPLAKRTLTVIIVVKCIVGWLCLVAYFVVLLLAISPLFLFATLWQEGLSSLFTCAPLQPFVVSTRTPLISQNETIRYQLHPCSAETLWADFEFTVNNATTMLQWPCVAGMPTWECYATWTTAFLMTPPLIAAVIFVGITIVKAYSFPS